MPALTMPQSKHIPGVPMPRDMFMVVRADNTA